MRTRIKYTTHPEHKNISTSNVLKAHKRSLVVVVNWDDHSFEIIDVKTGLSVFSGEPIGRHPTATKRRIKRELKRLGAKLEKETRSENLGKNKTDSTDQCLDFSSEEGTTG